MKSIPVFSGRIIAALVALVVFAAAAGARSPERSVGDLARGADLVAVGAVSSLASEWNTDRTRIVTRVTFSVDEYLKGSRAERTLEILVPGGEVGEVGEIYSHVPRFHRDEQVVIFARRLEDGSYRVAGGDQGKVVLRREEKTGRLITDKGEVLEAFTERVRRAAAGIPGR